jgi:PAS domain-containing protein
MIEGYANIIEAGASAVSLPRAEEHASTLDPWRDQLQLLLQSTGEGIFGIDLDGRCTFINRAGARHALSRRRVPDLSRVQQRTALSHR